MEFDSVWEYFEVGVVGAQLFFGVGQVVVEITHVSAVDGREPRRVQGFVQSLVSFFRLLRRLPRVRWL